MALMCVKPNRQISVRSLSAWPYTVKIINCMMGAGKVPLELPLRVMESRLLCELGIGHLTDHEREIYLSIFGLLTAYKRRTKSKRRGKGQLTVANYCQINKCCSFFGFQGTKYILCAISPSFPTSKNIFSSISHVLKDFYLPNFTY